MKKKKHPLLSICIPTFNRASSLEQLMNQLSSQISGFDGTVEICVSDNCSSDQTPQVVEEWSKKLPIRYNQNKANLGYDGNILALLSMANGTYAWFMGDDDAIEPDSIGRVLQDVPLAAKQKASVIYINACDRRGPDAKCGFDTFKIFSKKKADYPPLNASFIGSVCIDTSLARKIMKGSRISEGRLVKGGKEQTRLPAFLHSYIFLECLLHREFFGIEPRVAVSRIGQGSNTGGSSYEKRFYINLLLLTYPFELKKYYPWFSDGSEHYDLRAQLVRTALVSAKPEFEKPYLACLALYLKLLELNGKTGEAVAVKAYECVRKNVVVRLAVAQGFKLAASILKVQIAEENDGASQYEKKIESAMLRAEKIMRSLEN